MSRIEDIKKNSDEYAYAYGGENLALQDIEYLLSRLEIAEKALDGVTEWLEHDELKLSTELRDELKKLKAIQQLRE